MIEYYIQVMYRDYSRNIVTGWYCEDAGIGDDISRCSLGRTVYHSRTSAIQSMYKARHSALWSDHVFGPGKVYLISSDGNQPQIEKKVIF